jgi:hypothetical protein
MSHWIYENLFVVLLAAFSSFDLLKSFVGRLLQSVSDVQSHRSSIPIPISQTNLTTSRPRRIRDAGLLK